MNRATACRAPHSSSSALALRSGETRPSPRENVYGHQKRLRFIEAQLGEQLLRLGKAPEAMEILDVGCGTGVMITRPLALQGFRLTGLDIDSTSIERAARLNFEPHLPNLAYVTGALEEQPWIRSFDAVICSEILEHVEDPDRLINRLKGCLKPGGLLLVTVPNGYGLFELDSHLWQLLQRIPGFWRLEEAWVKATHVLLALLGRRRRIQAAREAEDRADNLASLNDDSPHCQSFTYSKVTKLFRRNGLEMIASGKSALWAGPMANLVMRDFNGLVALNCRVVDFLPSWMASGMYFCFRNPG